MYLKEYVFSCGETSEWIAWTKACSIAETNTGYSNCSSESSSKGMGEKPNLPTELLGFVFAYLDELAVCMD